MFTHEERLAFHLANLKRELQDLRGSLLRLRNRRRPRKTEEPVAGGAE